MNRLLPLLLALVFGCSAEAPAPANPAEPADSGAQGPEAGEGEGEPPGDDLPGATGPEAPRMQDWPCPPDRPVEIIGQGEDWEFAACPLPFPAAPMEVGGACPETPDGLPSEAAIRQAAPGYEGAIHYVGAGRIWQGAYGRAADGDIIVLGPGRHAGQREVGKRIALIGACTAGTTIDAVRILAPAALADLTIEAAESHGVFARDIGGRLTLDRVEIADSIAEGVLAVGEGTEVVITDVAVRQTRLSVDEQFGFCVHGAERAELTLKRVDLQRCGLTAIVAGGWSKVTARDLAVRETRGVAADDGAEVVVERATFDEVGDYAVASLTLGDALAPPADSDG